MYARPRDAEFVGERAGQRGANPGQARRRVDGQCPQARTVLRVENNPSWSTPVTVPDDAAVVVAHGDEIGHRIVVLLVVPDDVDWRGTIPHRT